MRVVCVWVLSTSFKSINSPVSFCEYTPLFRVAGANRTQFTGHLSPILELLSGGIPLCHALLAQVQPGLAVQPPTMLSGETEHGFARALWGGQDDPPALTYGSPDRLVQTDLLSTQKACKITPV